ncbi:chemotaxis protein CheW [bacterium]|nr:chemotaxis protein CheW [bacterium]
MDNELILSNNFLPDTTSLERLYLVFSVENKDYAISSNNIIELTYLPKLNFIKKTPNAIIGLLNYKGKMIKVIDLRIVLGEKLKPFSVSEQMIIVEYKSLTIAFVIEKIINVYSIHEEQVQDLPYHQASSIIKNTFQLENKMVSVIDLNAVEQYLEFTSSSFGETDYEALFPNDEKSLAVLSARADILAKEDEVIYDIHEQRIDQYLFVTLANAHYCLNIKFIKELITKNNLKISPLPNTPDFIKGVTNLRGEFVTILDLYNYLSKRQSIETSSQKLILINSEEYKIAFLVDDIQYIKTIDASKLYMHENRGGNKFVYAEFYEGEELYSILNIEKIILDKQLLINIS